MSELQQLIGQIVAFRDARDWKQYHTPKNLSAALAIEVGELQETMLWKTDFQVIEHLGSSEGKRAIAAELADVLIYSLLLCEATDIDPVTAIRDKLAENERKYPVTLARGTALKYDKLK